jgi:hypothetical protein
LRSLGDWACEWTSDGTGRRGAIARVARVGETGNRGGDAGVNLDIGRDCPRGGHDGQATLLACLGSETRSLADPMRVASVGGDARV